MRQLTIPKSSFLLLGTLGYIVLFIITLNHRQPPLFDEPLFIPNVALYEEHGLSTEFLREMDNQAPGPLYQIVHSFLKPVTHMETPGIRLVNTVMAGLMVIILAAAIMQLQAVPFREALYPAVALMAVPMVWQVSGMALTEVPAMFFASLSLLCIVTGIKQTPLVAALYAIPAGICMGLAIIGRSPFLLMVPALPVLLLYNNVRNAGRWAFVLICGAIALAICVPVFWAWQGLMPPKQAFTGAGGIVPWHGILAFAYAALFTFLIAPGWFRLNRNILLALLAGYIVLLLLNIFVLHYEYAPLDRALAKVFPSQVMAIYPFIISPALATLALWFICCCGLQAFENRHDTQFLFLLLCGLFILATSFKVTHLFSSRYVAQAAPVFIILYAGYDRMTAGRLGRLALGMFIGFLSLETYFLFK